MWSEYLSVLPLPKLFQLRDPLPILLRNLEQFAFSLEVLLLILDLDFVVLKVLGLFGRLAGHEGGVGAGDLHRFSQLVDIDHAACLFAYIPKLINLLHEPLVLIQILLLQLKLLILKTFELLLDLLDVVIIKLVELSVKTSRIVPY